jgi:Cu(I)/Ag(I) efflux system periplasmic protein CusF
MQGSLTAMALALALAAPLVHADAAHHGPGAATAQAAGLAEGEVRRVNKETQRITVRHGPIVNLDMPAHTMVFQVKDPALLEQVKPGDKIRFEAEKVPGGYAITRIEPQQ